jgi:hypothetical protein
MIDIAIVKENYSRMKDEELIRLSQYDGNDLTPEAIDALCQEFLKRNLDTTIFSSLRAHKIAEHQRQLQDIKAAKAQKYAASFWTYCFEAKSKGKTDDEIFQRLLEFGLDEEQSSMMINSIESRAIKIEKAYDNELWTGGAICGIGILVTATTFSAALNGGTYIVTWGAIIFGAIRFFNGLTNKSKISETLRKIQEQKQETTT